MSKRLVEFSEELHHLSIEPGIMCMMENFLLVGRYNQTRKMTIAEMLERQASTKVRRWMLNGENLKIKLVENYKFIVITFGIISSLFLISDIKFLAIIFWVLTLISYLVGWPLNQALQQNSDMKRDG